MSPPINRRTFLKYVAISTGAAGASSLISACGQSPGEGEAGPSPTVGTAGPRPTAPATDAIDIAAAQEEGALTLYSTATIEATEGLVRAFEEAHGIATDFYRADSTSMAQRVQREVQANRLAADVLIIDAPVMPQLTSLMIEWDPESRAPIPNEYKKPTYTRIRIYAGALAWNTELVQSDPPTDWESLADPRWRDRLALVDANQTVTGIQLFEMLKETYGRDYLEQLAANNPRVDRTGIAISEAIGAGETPVGTTYDYSFFLVGGTGAPFQGVIPDLTIATGSEAGVFQQAPHPNAAKLFYDYACSPDGQVALNEAGHSIATHPDAEVEDAHILADLNEVYPTDFSTLADRAEELLAEFNQLFR